MKAGTLEIELLTNVLKLQDDMERIKRSVSGMETSVSKSVSAANDNIAGMGKGAKLAGHQIQNLTYQLNDVAVSLASGQAPMTVFMQQGTQIAQIMAQAGVGVGGVVKQLGGLVGGFLMAHPILAAVGVAAGVAAAAIGMITSEINKNSKVQVTWTDTVLGAWDLAKNYLTGQLSEAFRYFGTTSEEVWAWVTDAAKTSINFLIGVGTFAPRAIVAAFQTMPAAIADVFYSAVNFGIRGINSLVERAVSAINAFANMVNPLLEKAGLSIPKLGAPQIAELQNNYAGAARAAVSTFAKVATDTWQRDYIGDLAAGLSGAAQNRAKMREAAEKAGEDVGKAGGAAAGRAMAKEAADKFAEDFAKFADAGMNGFLKNFASMQKTWASDAADAFAEMKKELIGGPEAEAIERYEEAMSRLRDISESIDLSSAFGGVGEALQGAVDYMERLGEATYAYEQGVKAAGTNQVKLAKVNQEYDRAKLANTVQLLGSAKRLFKEQSAGYKMVEAAEKAAAALAMVNTVKSVAAGASKIFSQLGVWAFPVVGAMMAVMAGLGFGGGGSTAIPPMSAEDMQDAAGTGSVLGDKTAKSASIANSLEILASNSNRDLEYSNGMLLALRSIDTNIGALSGNIARQISVSGSMFDTSNLRLGSTGSGGFLGIGATSKTRELYDLGLNLNSGTLADILANGITGTSYQIVKEVSKSSGFFGIGGSTKTRYQTTTGAIDESIRSSIVDVVSSLRTGLIEASKVIGIEGSAAILDGFRLELGKISFANMTGQEIEDQLNAIFSKAGDDMAAALLPSLKTMQLVGEGLFETLTRVAREYQVVDTSLKSIGMQFGAVGLASVEARDALVQLFGSLDQFAQQTQFFGDKFLTSAEQLAPIAASVRDEMARLGLSGVTTREQFKQVVQGIDLTSTAGQELYAALMAVAPAFDQVVSAAEATAAKRKALELKLMELQGRAAEALAASRAAELAGMDASLRGIQQQIWLYEDLGKAKNDLNAAYKREKSALDETAKSFATFGANLRATRDSLIGTSAGGSSYQAAMVKLMTTGSLAASGDKAALGDLSNVAQNFAGLARDNASSLTQYQRDMALVASYLDGGIAAADYGKTTAERQLEALDLQVGKLIDINESVLSVTEAIERVELLLPRKAPEPQATGPSGKSGNDKDRREREKRVEDKMDRMQAALEQSAFAWASMSRIFKNADRGGAIAIVTDSDTPIQTVSA